MGSLWAGGSIQLAASDPWERLRVDPSLDAYPYAVIYIYIYIYNIVQVQALFKLSDLDE